MVKPDLQDEIARLPLEVKIGQMLMAGVRGTDLGDDARWVIGQLHVGNIILMGRNAAAPATVLRLTQELQAEALRTNGVGLLIGIDQEGGQVQRFGSATGFTDLPSAAVVGATNDPELVRRYARMMGDELRAVGVNMDLAPVLDVFDNPDNPVVGRRGRAFGTTPDHVAQMATAFIAGLHDAGLLATGKHFPGHGNTQLDSHLALPTLTKSRAEIAQTELIPFQAAIAAGIDAVLPAYVTALALDPTGLPASISPAIQADLLRGQLGFRGLIVSDDMGMTGITAHYSPEESAVRAVLAGTDILTCVRMMDEEPGKQDLLPGLRAGLLDAVHSGRILLARIDASVARILAVKRAACVGPASGEALERIGSAAHRQLVDEVTTKSFVTRRRHGSG